MLFLFPLLSYYTRKNLGKFICLYVLTLTFFTIKDVHFLFFFSVHICIVHANMPSNFAGRGE